MATSHTLTVHPDQQLRIEQLAAEQLRSPEFVLHDAVDAYLERAASERESLSPQRNWLNSTNESSIMSAPVFTSPTRR